MPEQNWEGEPLKTPKIRIKYIAPFRVVLAIAIIAVGALIWQFGNQQWNKIEANIYAKGVEAGKQESLQAIFNSVAQTGQFQIGFTDQNNQQQVLILIEKNDNRGI